MGAFPKFFKYINTSSQKFKSRSLFEIGPTSLPPRITHKNSKAGVVRQPGVPPMYCKNVYTNILITTNKPANFSTQASTYISLCHFKAAKANTKSCNQGFVVLELIA